MLAGDDEDEEIESKSVDLVLRNLVNGEFAAGAGTVTAAGRILDDDDPWVVVSLHADAYGVSESHPRTPAIVGFSVDRDPERTLAVPLEFTHVGGASTQDYVADRRVRFLAGGPLTVGANVFANADAIDDDGESVSIGFGTLPPRATAGTSGQATVRITDNDNPLPQGIGVGAAGQGGPRGASVLARARYATAQQRSSWKCARSPRTRTSS